jgi:hypothetical protein
MAQIHPTWDNIKRLRVPPEPGELHLLEYLEAALDNSFEVFFNSYLDGDRPDIIILKKDHGAVVIEVKDWNLSHYHINEKNEWQVENSEIKSPFQQAFKYKNNLFELHLPVLGLKELSNKHFYGVIDVYVYFHNASRHLLKSRYEEAVKIARDARHQINVERQKYSFVEYEKRREYWNNKLRQMERDISISICHDTIEKDIGKIRNIRSNILFKEEIYDDFKRRLLPPTHVKMQGIPISFDVKQQKLTNSAAGFSKIKGVAGCGKTSILAQRAVNALIRHEDNVLILTYNITIRHYIKDVISRICGMATPNNIEVIHYHSFINSKLNEHGIDIQDRMNQYQGTDKEKLEKLYSDLSLFSDVSPERYKSIFIDEVQDYEPNWIKIIRDNFLEEAGEMVLFGDQSQNIYQREENRRESAIVKGFGAWNKLTKSFRSKDDAPLIALFSNFQKEFLLAKYSDSEIFESIPTQSEINFDILAYESYGHNINASEILQRINSYVFQNNLHPNDVVILASEVDPLFEINCLLDRTEKTKVMFETIEELNGCSADGKIRKLEIEKIRRRKKMHFYLNSGLLKLSTIHSFKGLEAETAFLILLPEDTPEVIYTGMTRAKKNLIVFGNETSPYHEFFFRKIGMQS